MRNEDGSPVYMSINEQGMPAEKTTKPMPKGKGATK